MKKLLIIVSLLIIFFVLILFLEKREENGTIELNYWILDFDKIIYSPPTKEWNEKILENFNYNKIELTQSSNIFDKEPLFVIKNFNTETNESYVYEASYNVRNLYRDITELKVNSVIEINKKSLENFQIDEFNSPSLELYKSNNLLKKLVLGIKHDKNAIRFIKVDQKEIISIRPYIIDQFRKDIFTLRTRNIINKGEDYYTKLKYITFQKKAEVENYPTQIGVGRENYWRRTTGVVQFINPVLGNTWESHMNSLRIDLFPDEESASGLKLAQERTSIPSDYSFYITLSNGYEYVIRVYKPIEIDQILFRPATYEIIGRFVSSPFYIKDLNLSKIVNHMDRIIAAPPYKKLDNNVKKNQHHKVSKPRKNS